MASPAPRRGRPVQIAPAEREQMILDAAERLLLSRGLRGMTMAAVARDAGMSKRTLYTVFDGRAALFVGLVRRLRSQIVAPLAPWQEALPLADRLRLLLASRERTPVTAAPLEVLRAVVAEAPQHPDLAESLLEEGPRAIRRLIRAELDRGVARGEIAIDDTDEAASLLHDMALPCPFEKLLSRDARRRPPQDAWARAERAIEVFLSAARSGAENGPTPRQP